jgi:hypothetical protein
MEEKDQNEVEEQIEERMKGGDCGSYFKVHFNSVDIDGQMPHDETQVMCTAINPPMLLNRFDGSMGLTKEQSPFIKSCTHFGVKDSIAVARKMLDWFFSREDHIKKQSYEPLLLELANFLVDDKEFESVDQVLGWMSGEEEKPETEEDKES